MHSNKRTLSRIWFRSWSNSIEQSSNAWCTCSFLRILNEVPSLEQTLLCVEWVWAVPSAIMTIIVSLLRIVRKEGIVIKLEDAISGHNQRTRLSPSMLLNACGESEALLIDTLELASMHPKWSTEIVLFDGKFAHRPTEFPGDMDYDTVKTAVLTVFRTNSQNIRNKWQSLMERFLNRLKVAVSACITKQRNKQRRKLYSIPFSEKKEIYFQEWGIVKDWSRRVS